MITLRPVGGLCNRLFAIDSMIRICETIEKDLKIIWIRNEELGSFFSELYKPLNHPTVKIELLEFDKRPFLFSDRLLSNPRQKLFNTLLKVYQLFYFDRVFHASHTAKLNKSGFDFHELKHFKSPYISSWGRLDHQLFNKKFFKPIDRIHEKFLTFSSPTIGVHIRRTDHQLVINKTPLIKFYEVMDNEIKKNPEVKFFIASDSAEVKIQLATKYPDQLITHSPEKSDRSSSTGMINAMIDLYSLANTEKIIGTAMSTFTLMASEINGIELVEISL